MTPKQYRIIFTLLLLIILVLPVTAQQGCPDLIIRKLTVSPMNPSPRSIVTVRVEVQNIGDTMTPDFTWCKIIYPGGPKQFKILKMSNNRIQIVNHKFRLPNTLPRVQVVAMVNVSNFSMSRHLRFRECDMKNNVKSVDFKISCPDIAIENVKWPVNINLRKNPRQVLQFKVSIRNRGNIKSPNSVLELRMANFILKNVKIPHLNPNGTYAVYVRIPAKIAINHISHRLVQKSSFVRTELNLMRWPLECEFRNNSKSKSIRLYR